jgi:hypothetical protein
MSTAIKWIMAASLIGASGTATAQVTYDYSGSNFSAVSGLYTTSDSVQGSLTLPSALAANLYEATIIPSAYSFSDGVQTITNGGEFGFSISTNASGQISAWSAEVFSPVNNYPYTSSGIGMYSFPIDLGFPGEPTIYDTVSNDQIVVKDGVATNVSSFATSNHAGVWTSPITVPEIDPASAARGLALLVGGLVVLRGRRPQRLAA